MDVCRYVDIFHGCGEINLPKPEGIAAKWFFIKAGCGNTSPAAMMPYGAMSVSPYSGGYPTGYGDHCVNSHSRPRHFEEGKKLYGFAHLQQSGTGTIGYYYNYALTVPHYESSSELRAPEKETAQPGYYACTLEDIRCEVTADKRTAVHRYSFGKENGTVTVDFSNEGIRIPGWNRDFPEIERLEEKDGIVYASVYAKGIRLYFVLTCNGTVTVGKKTVSYALGNEKTAELHLSVSLRSCEKALTFLQASAGFDETKTAAYEKWNSELSKMEIETKDTEILRIFYSNLYHSLVKPADWDGESFLYDNDGPFVTDFATLWDMYKTALPLIFMINREMGEKITETLLCTGESLGLLPNALGLTDRYKEHDAQARMLGDYVLLTGYRYGVKTDVGRMLRVIENDVFAENKLDFTRDGKCGSHTWMLDMADGCALAAQLAKEQGDMKLHDRLVPLAMQWKKCYSEETGLLDSDSSYYEGTLYNYSFRPMVDMDARMALAGGKEGFVRLLDNFFGYGAPDTVQPTNPNDYTPVAQGMTLGRFEGFNNESDTESPFSYIYADRHDRTCEIIRAGMRYMFTTGRGGIPGNNDTGALSSYYVMMAVGLFPVAGQDLFLLASPFVDRAVIRLFNDKTLEITVDGNAPENIYVQSVSWNGKEVDGFRIPASELLQGGTLAFRMSDRKAGE